MLLRLETSGIEYCEQPLARWDLDGFRHLRERVSIPIMADESVFDHHDAFKLTAGGCCDYLNIKLAKSGGIHMALKINAVAEASGSKCMLGCMMETRLGLTAAAHLASARPNIRYLDLDGHFQLQIRSLAAPAGRGRRSPCPMNRASAQPWTLPSSRNVSR